MAVLQLNNYSILNHEENVMSESRATLILNTMKALTKLCGDFKTNLQDPIEKQLLLQNELIQLMASVNENQESEQMNLDQVKLKYSEKIKQAGKLNLMTTQWVSAFTQVNQNKSQMDSMLLDLAKIDSALKEIKTQKDQGQSEMINEMETIYSKQETAIKNAQAMLEKQDEFKMKITQGIKQTENKIKLDLLHLKECAAAIQNGQESNAKSTGGIYKNNMAVTLQGQSSSNNKIAIDKMSDNSQVRSVPTI